jgi:hypothetical protein
MPTPEECDFCLDLFEKHDIIDLKRGFIQKIVKFHPDKHRDVKDKEKNNEIFIELMNCKDEIIGKDMLCKSRFQNKNSYRRRQEETKRDEERQERERQERERQEREQEEMLGRLPKILTSSEAKKLQISNEERKKKNRENIERLKKNIRSKRKSKEEKLWRLPKILTSSEAKKIKMSNEERKKNSRENIEKLKTRNRSIRTMKKAMKEKEEEDKKVNYMLNKISAKKIQEMFRGRSLYTQLNKKIKEEEKAISKIQKSYRKSKFRKSIRHQLKNISKKLKMHKELKDKTSMKTNRHIRRLSQKLSRQQLSKIREEQKLLNDMNVVMERFSKMNLKRKRSSGSSKKRQQSLNDMDIVSSISSSPKHKRSRLRG